jgi:NAD(P)-dependent dehydrogenase (short-subunit alcohol dehydrogenase family)
MLSGNQKPRTIVVTGGGSGIGRAVALLCAERGDKVAVIDINAESATACAEHAASNGANLASGSIATLAMRPKSSKHSQLFQNSLGRHTGFLQTQE